MKTFSRFLQDESGATAIEYGFLAALIVIGIIASVTTIGQNFVSAPLNTVQTHLGR